MRITSKYILREHLGPLAFALTALTSLLLLNYIARRLGDLVGKGLPWRAIAEVLMLSVPFTVAMTLPMAVLVSTLYAFSRLGAENEVTAFKASGFAIRHALLGPVLRAVGLVVVFMIFFNDQVLSRANNRLSLLLQDIARTKPTFALREQVINEVTPSFLLRAARVDRTQNTMRDVTIYDLTLGQSPRTIRADSGALALAANRRDLQLTLYDGSIEQVGQNRSGELQRTFYKTNLVRVRDVVADSFARAGQGTPGQPGAQFTFKSDREMSVCELSDAYLRARKEFLLAELELDQAIADSLRRPRPTQTPRRRVFIGLGRAYCNALQAVQVRAASAQPPLPVQQPPDTARRQPPDTTRRQPADTLRRPAPDTARPVPAPPVPTPPVPSPVPGQPVPTPVPTPVPPQPGIPVPAIPPPVAGIPTDTSAAAAPIATPGPVPSTPADSAAAAAIAAANQPLGANASMTMLARMRRDDTRSTMNGYTIEIHKKFALAVAPFVFVLLGAPIALRFPRGGVGMVIGVSLFVFALYYAFLIAGEELAQRGYSFAPPAVAMWAANVVFGLVGFALASRMGNESGSARGGGFGEMLDNFRYRMRRPRSA